MIVRRHHADALEGSYTDLNALHSIHIGAVGTIIRIVASSGTKWWNAGISGVAERTSAFGTRAGNLQRPAWALIGRGPNVRNGS